MREIGHYRANDQGLKSELQEASNSTNPTPSEKELRVILHIEDDQIITEALQKKIKEDKDLSDYQVIRVANGDNLKGILDTAEHYMHRCDFIVVDLFLGAHEYEGITILKEIFDKIKGIPWLVFAQPNNRNLVDAEIGKIQQIDDPKRIDYFYVPKVINPAYDIEFDTGRSYEDIERLIQCIKTILRDPLRKAILTGEYVSLCHLTDFDFWTKDRDGNRMPEVHVQDIQDKLAMAQKSLPDFYVMSGDLIWDPDREYRHQRNFVSTLIHECSLSLRYTDKYKDKSCRIVVVPGDKDDQQDLFEFVELWKLVFPRNRILPQHNEIFYCLEEAESDFSPCAIAYYTDFPVLFLILTPMSLCNGEYYPISKTQGENKFGNMFFLSQQDVIYVRRTIESFREEHSDFYNNSLKLIVSHFDIFRDCPYNEGNYTYDAEPHIDLNELLMNEQFAALLHGHFHHSVTADMTDYFCKRAVGYIPRISGVCLEIQRHKAAKFSVINFLTRHGEPCNLEGAYAQVFRWVAPAIGRSQWRLIPTRASAELNEKLNNILADYKQEIKDKAYLHNRERIAATSQGGTGKMIEQPYIVYAIAGAIHGLTAGFVDSILSRILKKRKKELTSQQTASEGEVDKTREELKNYVESGQIDLVLLIEETIKTSIQIMEDPWERATGLFFLLDIVINMRKYTLQNDMEFDTIQQFQLDLRNACENVRKSKGESKKRAENNLLKVHQDIKTDPFFQDIINRLKELMKK